MQLEEYFDFDNPNGIRIHGTRINIENVICLAAKGYVPGRILQSLPSLTLEQIHASLAYYYRNREQMDAYFAVQEAAYDEAKRLHEQGKRPEVVERLLRLRAEKERGVPT